MSTNGGASSVPGEPSGREVRPQHRARERRVGVRPVRDDERLPRTVVPELGVPPLDRALTPVARQRVGEQRDRVAGRDDRVDPVAHAALAGGRDAQRGVARRAAGGRRSRPPTFRRSRRRPRRHRRAQLHGLRAPGPGRESRPSATPQSAANRRREAARLRSTGGRGDSRPTRPARGRARRRRRSPKTAVAAITAAPAAIPDERQPFLERAHPARRQQQQRSEVEEVPVRGSRRGHQSGDVLNEPVRARAAGSRRRHDFERAQPDGAAPQAEA